MSSMKNTNKNIKVNYSREKISCNGGEGDLGHPKIYLIIDSKQDTVICPYCGQKYKKSN